jgi:peroxiredoxin family protein
VSHTIERVSIVVSDGSPEGIYPALIMADRAKAEGVEANLFFTSLGLDPLIRSSYEQVKAASAGRPMLIEMIADAGAQIYGCQASCDLLGLAQDDLIDQVQSIITVGEFYALAAGGQITFA